MPTTDPLSRWLRGDRPAPNPTRPSRDAESAISSALAEAPRAFLRDGRHPPTVVLIRGRRADPVAFDFSSRASRDALRGLARRLGAEAAVTVSEARVTSPSTGATLDALRAVVERAGRAPETFAWPVVREPGRPPRLGARSTCAGAPPGAPLVLRARAPAAPAPARRASVAVPDLSRMSRAEMEAGLRAAVGRIMSLMSRPEREGDAEIFDECRGVAVYLSEALGRPTPGPQEPPASALVRHERIFGDSG